MCGRVSCVSRWQGCHSWPALVALLAVSGLSAALPASLAVIPRWFVLVVVAGLLVPTIITHHHGQHALYLRLGSVVNRIVTAASLWIANILVFARWYWRLDADGPNHRDQRRGHPDGAFLFPQIGKNKQAKFHQTLSSFSAGTPSIPVASKHIVERHAPDTPPA